MSRHEIILYEVSFPLVFLFFIFLGTGPDVLAGGGEGLDVRPAFSFVL